MIDRIAREMVDVEPSVDLEARIRRRLHEARPNRTAAWWTWRVAVPVGAIASLALAFAVVQGPGSRVQSPVVIAHVPQVGSSPVPQFPSSQVARGGTSLLPKIPTSRLSKASSQLTSEERAWMDRRLPALEPVNALQMDQIGRASW